MERKGKFVVIEGGVGCGKTTLISRLAKTLGRNSWNYYREPGGTPFGNRVRDAVQSKQEFEIHYYEVTPTASLLAYNSSRANLVGLNILPDLINGTNVLLDRYIYSTYAYQGAEGVSKPLTLLLGLIATRGLIPDLVIHCDVPVEVGIMRKNASLFDIDRYDAHDPAFHERVRRNYKELSILFFPIWNIIDATPSADIVYGSTMDLLRKRRII